jgi:hypothetical protein
MAAEDIGNLFNTKIPGFEDAADIQAALRLFLYGSATYDKNNSDTSQLVNPSLAYHLQQIKNRVQAQETLGIGSDYLTSAPTSPEDGYIWMDANSGLSNVTEYSTVVYSPTAPTEDLVDGVIWIDKSASPVRGYVYDAGTTAWVAITEIPGIVDAAGDLVYGAGPDDIAKLSIGTNGQILQAVSGLPAWVDQKSWTLKGSGTLSGTGFSVSGISGEKVFIVLKDWSHDDATDSAMITVRFNNDSGPNYVNTGGLISASSLHSPVFADDVTHDLTISVDLANSQAALKPVSTIADNSSGQYFGYYKNTSEITSVQIALSPTGNFDAGTYQVWSFE